jgi:putative acyl-CoA dehydrogenase
LAIPTARPLSSVPQQTHEVLNQVSLLQNVNSAEDPALHEGLLRGSCDPRAIDGVLAFGKSCGSAGMIAKAAHANKYVPQLMTHDRVGNRIDCVEYQQSYHDLMDHGLSAGVAAHAWQNPLVPGAHVARGALLHLAYGLECGVVCPMTMTFAAVPALRASKNVALAEHWVPRIASGCYDPRDLPVEQKRGATIGMSMTEKQGGSDVRANTTVATPIDPNAATNGDAFTLVGHKWFTSAPMSDAFLTLAQTTDGISCFLVPRWLPDGTRNAGFHIMRLKDKIGDRANASSEVEYRDAVGFMLGSPGRGIPTILEMVVHTRLDCTIGSAALMRHATHQAVHHTSQRQAFGAYLLDQPVMRRVLADLAVESEAAVATWVRMAQAFDGSQESMEEQMFRRIAVAVAKYWVCKRAPAMVYESLECFGGNGYVEEGPMARLFRQSPLNSIWEGSGNVISLDIVRALQGGEEVGHALLNELNKGRGCDKRLDALLDTVQEDLFKPIDDIGPRYLADQLALALQGSILVQPGHSADVAEAFCALRLAPVGGGAGGRGWNFGAFGKNTLSEEVLNACIERARLQVRA